MVELKLYFNGWREYENEKYLKMAFILDQNVYQEEIRLDDKATQEEMQHAVRTLKEKLLHTYMDAHKIKLVELKEGESIP